MTFTKKELYEIEKMCDMLGGQTVFNTAKIINQLKDVDVAKPLIDFTIREGSEASDLFKSISVKAGNMRENYDKEMMKQQEE